MSQDFKLHARLKADTFELGEWELSTLLLLNDRRFPWLVLVPRRTGASEIHDLCEADRQLLMDELARASELLKQVSGADKINVGALGNIVPHLHLHVVARFKDDAAWPGPVWGSGTAEPYSDEAVATLRQSLGLPRSD